MVRIKPNCPLLQRKSFGRVIDDGAEELAETFSLGAGSRSCRAAGADARILPLAADVAAARPRGGDAAVSPVAAQSWPDRTAKGGPARGVGDRRHRGHRTRAGRLSARPEPVANIARPRSARFDRTQGGKDRPASRRGVDISERPKTDRGGG